MNTKQRRTLLHVRKNLLIIHRKNDTDATINNNQSIQAAGSTSSSIEGRMGLEYKLRQRTQSNLPLLVCYRLGSLKKKKRPNTRRLTSYGINFVSVKPSKVSGIFASYSIYVL